MTDVTDETIAITGCGWITPAAAGSIKQILAGGTAAPTQPPPNGRYRPVPDEILDKFAPASKECRVDGAARLAATAFELARSDAGLSSDAIAPERLGLVLGCSLSGQMGMIDFADDVREQSARFVSPIRFPQTVGNYVSGALARAFAIGGPNVTIACGAASGSEAILEARALLARGEADVVVAGASERLTDALARGLEGFQESCSAPRVSLSLAKRRKGAISQHTGTGAPPAAGGTVVSEGACMFVLERWANASKRGAHALAFVTAPSKDTTTHEGTAASDPIVSTAGFARCGAIFMEHKTGNCLGASGAAAVAGAIGAAGGHPVPWIDENNQVTIRTIDAAAIAQFDERGQAQASAIALNDDGEESVVALLLRR